MRRKLSTAVFAVVTVLPFCAFSQLLIGNTCNSSSLSQQWLYSPASGQLSSARLNLCLTALSYPVQDGTALLMSACSPTPNPAQAFDIVSSNNTIVVRGNHTKCVNLAGYGTNPGTSVWLYGCDPAPAYTCQGNCDWEPLPITGSAAQQFQNNASQLCLDDGYKAPQPATCDPSSPSYSLPLCDTSLSYEQRAADLVSRLSPAYKQSLLMIPLPTDVNAYVNASLALAAFHWDITAIRGVSTCCGFINPLPAATSFPHAIAQGASFDVDLARRIATATAIEARIINQIGFRTTAGTSVQALMAEGGPLANVAVHAVWGRNQETYSEDPYVAAVFGRAVTEALQNRSVSSNGVDGTLSPPASTSDGFYLLASMTRHFLGYHGATDLPNNGEEWVSPQWLSDNYLVPFKAQLVDAAAEAVMCAINTLRVGPGDGSAGGIPACVHPLLYDILRNQYNSSAIVQADNDALFPSFQAHHYYPDINSAVAGFLNSGVMAIDSGGGAQILQALSTLVVQGNITAAQVDEFSQRIFVSRMRLGEFDTNTSSNPYNAQQPFNESLLDGPEHRALAREAASKSTVLLANRGGVLPLSNGTARPMGFTSIAVIGPWSACNDTEGGYGCQMCFQGSYAATTSMTVSMLQALQEELSGASGVSIQYAVGTDPYAYASPTGLQDAVNLALASDITVLALGLGCEYETEGVDRPNLYLPPVQDALLAAITDALTAAGNSSKKLILVTVAGNTIDLDAERVDAWLHMFLPGEEGGHGLTDVLFGHVSPSARLPMTTYANEYLAISGPTADFNLVSNATLVGRTYRYAQYIPPQMIKQQFGFGLSYNTFSYSNLQVITIPQRVASSGVAAVNVSVSVSTLGQFPVAREVVQLYVAPPPVPGMFTPLLNLKGFTVVELAPAAAPTTVTFSLPYPDALLTSNPDGSQQVYAGTYTVYVSGHQPFDPNATSENSSNVVSALVQLPASEGLATPPLVL